MKKKIENYENFMKENDINEKQIIKEFPKIKINLIKCLKCKKISEIYIDQFSNMI